MTSVEILSNSIPTVRERNYTNQFEMPFPTPLDCSDRDHTLTVHEVTYPMTVRNVQNECWYQMNIRLTNIQRPRDFLLKWGRVKGNRLSEGEILLEQKTKTLPPGSYDVETLMRVLNNSMEEWGVEWSVNENQIVVVDAPNDALHWAKYSQHTHNVRWMTVAKPGDPTLDVALNTSASYDGGSFDVYRSNKINIAYEITLSERLAFILGFSDTTFVLGPDTHRFNAKYIPNPYGDLARIYVYCDIIERAIVGGIYTNMLLSIPLRVQGQGGGGVATYNPPKATHKIKRTIVDRVNISLRDNQGRLINFDSGTVTIKCTID